MGVLENVPGASLWWGELLEMGERVQGDVLVDGARGRREERTNEKETTYANWRHLSISRSRWRFS